MSTVNNVLNTGNQSTTQYDRSKIFIGDNQYEPQTLVAAAAAVTIPAGTVMGRVSASGDVTPLKSAAVDGSEIPYGILAEDTPVQIADTPNIPICVKGKVVLDKLVFDGADTVATVVDLRRLDDRIAADTVGIILIASTENTIYDNV